MKKYLLVLIIALASLTLQAQNEMRVVGKGESLPSELIDKTVRDANGETCAGLIISSDLDGLSYDSYNGIVKRNPKPGEDFLFLSPDERVVTIYKSGFTSLKIIMSEYGIKLKSGEVWKLKVTGDKVSSLLPITITVLPADAKIVVDGKEAFSGKTVQTAIGKHEVTISKEGYRTITKQIEVTQQQVVFSFALQEIELQSVTISSNPDGAKIYLDNNEKGITNKGMFLYPGSYNLKLSKSGYLDKEEKIEVAVGKENKFNYSFTKNVGVLSITVTPSDATVLINKEPHKGTAPLELSPGKYKIEVSKEGYYETGETIEIELGKTVTKSYTLVPKVGKLQFSVSPPEATAELSRNGKTVQTWQGLKILKDVQVGEYDFTVKSSGYITVTKKIRIEENKTAVEDVQLIQGNDKLQQGEFNYAGKTYHSIKIGTQVWMQENLDVGTMIQGSANPSDNGKIEKYCYDNDPSNCTTYGGLYQWNEAMQYVTTAGTQGICPTGWHIPTKAEFETLKVSVGNDGNKLKGEGQGTGSGVGTNTSGFSALLAGYRYNNGTFSSLGYTTYFWSSTESYAAGAYGINLWYDGSGIGVDYNVKGNGFSVRCLED